MSLRARLLLGYGYLVVLMLLAAGTAAMGFLELGGEIDRVLAENYASIEAATQMMENLERQDSQTLTALLEGTRPEELAEHDAAFEEAFERAESNVTLDAEPRILEELNASYQDYRSSRERLLSESHDRPVRAYEAGVAPEMRKAKARIAELLEVNRKALYATGRDARQTAGQYGIWLGVLVTVALLSLVFLSRGLRSMLLARLSEIRKVMADISGGQRHRRLQETHDDELGAISREFNRAMDTEDHVRSEMRGRLNEHKQLVLSLLHDHARPVCVLGLDGSTIATTMSADQFDRVRPHFEWVRRQGRQQLKEMDAQASPPGTEIELAGDDKLVFRLLTAGHDRPMGWLVSYEDPSAKGDENSAAS